MVNSAAAAQSTVTLYRCWPGDYQRRRTFVKQLAERRHPNFLLPLADFFLFLCPGYCTCLMLSQSNKEANESEPMIKYRRYKSEIVRAVIIIQEYVAGSWDHNNGRNEVKHNEDHQHLHQHIFSLSGSHTAHTMERGDQGQSMGTFIVTGHRTAEGHQRKHVNSLW